MNDSLITNVSMSPEDSKYKEEYIGFSVNFTTGSPRNQARSPVRIIRFSILVETVNDSRFIKVWSISLSW